MPGKAAKVRLSEKQLAMLTDIAKSRSLPQVLTQRANSEHFPPDHFSSSTPSLPDPGPIAGRPSTLNARSNSGPTLARNISRSPVTG